MHSYSQTQTLVDQGDYVPLRCSEWVSVGIKVSGAFVGSITFTAQVDEVPYGGSAVTVYDETGTAVSSITAAGTFVFQASGHAFLTAIYSSKTSGTPVVTLTPSASAYLPPVAAGSGPTSNVAVTSSVLPTGASTSALQTTGNGYLATIAANTPLISSQAATATLTAVSGVEGTGIATIAKGAFNFARFDVDFGTVVYTTAANGIVSSNTTLTLASGTFPAGINGYTITGSFIPAGTTVTTGAGTSSLTISQAATASTSGLVFAFSPAGGSITFLGSRDGGSTYPDTLSMTRTATGTLTKILAVTDTVTYEFGDYTHIKVVVGTWYSGSIVVKSKLSGNSYTQLADVKTSLTTLISQAYTSAQALSTISQNTPTAVTQFGNASLSTVGTTEGVGVVTVARGLAHTLSFKFILGDAVSPSVTFKGSLDNGATFTEAISGVAFGSGAVSAAIPTVTGTQALEFSFGNFTHIRATLDSISSGTFGVSWSLGGTKLVKLAALGNQDDATASTDTGTASLIALTKRLLGKTPALGGAVAASSTPVALAVDQPYPYKTITGLSSAFTTALTTSQNNILDSSGAGAWTDARGFSTLMVQIASLTGTTAGTIVFEVSPDSFGSIVTAIPVGQLDTATNCVVLGNTTAFSSALTKVLVLQGLTGYVRARVSVNFANSGGSSTATVTAFAYGTNVQVPLSSTVSLGFIKGGTAASPATLGSGAVPLGSALTAQMLLADRASAVITTTSSTGTGLLTDDYGISAGFIITVAGVGGTNPTLDLVLQVTSDNGTTYRDAYHVERITANGSYFVPEMAIDGRRRWVWTVGGTNTPTFTVAITANRSSRSMGLVRQFFDRTLDLAILNAATAAYFVGGCSQITALVNAGAETTPASFVLELSMDKVTWFAASTATATVASTAVAAGNTLNVMGNWARIKTSTAGTGTTLNYAGIYAS